MANTTSLRICALPIIVSVLFFALLQLGHAQTMVPSPAPQPTSDGHAIDQGIAYVLLMVALAITYLVH